MFIGRERELSSLEKLYRSDKFEFAVVHGRHELEKPLLSHFIKDKNSIYFMGIESNAKQNLENFSRSILESDSRNPAESVFLTFQSALEYVFRRSRNRNGSSLLLMNILMLHDHQKAFLLYSSC